MKIFPCDAIFIRENINKCVLPYYQPIYDIKNSTSVGAEILARFHHPSNGLLTPAQFLPYLHSSEDIKNMTCSLLFQTGEVFKKIKFPSRFFLSFNIPANLIYEPWVLVLCKRLQTVTNSRIDIIIELTESYSLSAPENEISNAIRQFERYNIKIALDDFGCGYSGLDALLKTKAKVIKIPKIFIDKITSDPISRIIILNILELATSLDLDVIVEGVETKKQMQFLKKIGIHYVQGYFFSKPLSGSDFFNKVFDK
ncbi:EAL domain-containing protein [Salmonella enterica]|nr:EAL domain-containing protein [Salmonella enterica]EJW0033265.1 EAL domain-containing protein [Salmonella enterica]